METTIEQSRKLIELNFDKRKTTKYYHNGELRFGIPVIIEDIPNNLLTLKQKYPNGKISNRSDLINKMEEWKNNIPCWDYSEIIRDSVYKNNIGSAYPSNNGIMFEGKLFNRFNNIIDNIIDCLEWKIKN